jgi:hypothetical protein
MKYKIDENNVFVEVVSKFDGIPARLLVEKKPPEGIHIPFKWNEETNEWVTLLTPQEIEESKKPFIPQSPEQHELEQLKKRTEAAENAILTLMDLQIGV